MIQLLLVLLATCGHKATKPQICDSVPDHVTQQFADALKNDRRIRELEYEHFILRKNPYHLRDGYLISPMNNWRLKVCRDAQQLLETEHHLLILTGKIYTLFNFSDKRYIWLIQKTDGTVLWQLKLKDSIELDKIEEDKIYFKIYNDSHIYCISIPNTPDP